MLARRLIGLLANTAIEVDRCDLERELLRFYLRKIKNIINDAQQRLRREVDRLQILSLLVVKLSLGAKFVIPTTPFIGILISLLMLARNSLLARLARSALSLALSSSAVLSRTRNSRFLRSRSILEAADSVWACCRAMRFNSRTDGRHEVESIVTSNTAQAVCSAHRQRSEQLIRIPILGSRILE